MNVHCYNCNRDTSHLAMYCDIKPQKIRRCEECWAAATRDPEHIFTCYKRKNYGELSPADQAHRIQPRVLIRTTGPGIRIFENMATTTPSIATNYQSRIAENITFHWPNQRGFCVMGPKSMYFRLPIISGKNVAMRVDVLFDSMNMNIINQPINRIANISNPNQTVCVLRVANMAQKIDVVMPKQSFSIMLDKKDDAIVVNRIDEETESEFNFDDENIQYKLKAIEPKLFT